MKNNQKPNATLVIEPNDYNGKSYYNIKATIALDNGEYFDCYLDIKCSDKKRKAKMLYKLSNHIIKV